MKIFQLMEQVMRREKADGSYRLRNRKLARQAFGKKTCEGGYGCRQWRGVSFNNSAGIFI